MTGKLSKKFHGVDIGPLSNILAVKGSAFYLTAIIFEAGAMPALEGEQNKGH